MRDSVQAAGTATSEASRPALYLALTKPDVSFLVVMTTVAGYALGTRGPLPTYMNNPNGSASLSTSTVGVNQRSR